MCIYLVGTSALTLGGGGGRKDLIDGGESGAFGDVECSTESWRCGDKSGCTDATAAGVMPRDLSTGPFTILLHLEHFRENCKKETGRV